MKAALYGRYSTDRQSESSIEDQFRVCADRCAKEGLQVVARFEDQGISGAATGNRPGFLAMYEAAVAGHFDALVVMDLTRMSRSQGDMSKIIDRLTARGIRVIGVQDGYDNNRKGHKLQAGLSGIIGEAFRDMCSERTYSALESRALQGKPAGGKRYGYGEGEAKIVRQIFEWYADGHSVPWIAAELNRREVPSPGTAWKRVTRRRGGWHPSAIAGDRKRGVGLLNNESYIGRTVWNRCKWVKDPDSGKRRSVLRPRSQWIIHEDEARRIIQQKLWDRVKARQADRTQEVGQKIARGLKSSGGHPARYLFSGLLKCECCGSSFVMTNTRSYACSGYVNGKICDNSILVTREVVEDRLLAGIREDLLTEKSIALFKAKLLRRLRQRPVDHQLNRRRELSAEIENLADAIGQGLISPTITRRLQAAEAELTTLPVQAAKVVSVEDLLARLPEALKRVRQMVARLGDAPIDVEKARVELKRLLGPIWIAPKDGYLVARMGLDLQPLQAVFNRGSGGRI